jgi:hypothetical protein
MSKYKHLFQYIDNTKVNFVGVVWDAHKNLALIKDDILSNGILWPNILSDLDLKNGKSITDILRIEAIPSCILFDKTGKILYRGAELEKVENILSGKSLLK